MSVGCFPLPATARWRAVALSRIVATPRKKLTRKRHEDINRAVKGVKVC